MSRGGGPQGELTVGVSLFGGLKQRSIVTPKPELVVELSVIYPCGPGVRRVSLGGFCLVRVLEDCSVYHR